MVMVGVIGQHKSILALSLLYLDLFGQLLNKAVYCLTEKLDEIPTILLNQALAFKQVFDVGYVIPLVQLDDQDGWYHILVELSHQCFPLG